MSHTYDYSIIKYAFSPFSYIQNQHISLSWKTKAAYAWNTIYVMPAVNYKQVSLLDERVDAKWVRGIWYWNKYMIIYELLFFLEIDK